MFNELLWILVLLISFSGVLISFKFFGRAGIYLWIALSVILANMQVLKTIALFGAVVALGDIIYSSIFLCIDILNERYGKKEARKGVLSGFFVLFSTLIIMQLTLFFIPHESDFMSEHLEAIFGFFPRIVVASLLAYLVSQNLSVYLYDKFKKKTHGKKLWLRNNLSTIISQLTDNLIFTFIAFVGFGVFWERLFDWNIIIQIFFTSLIIKTLIALADTPFMYISRKIKDPDLN